MFRIKKGREAKQETLGGTLDSVHQTVVNSLRESHANQTSLADQIKELEAEINELESGKDIFKLAQKHDKLRTLQSELKEQNQLDSYFLKNSY
jgi:predicted nuclease with TOPRIM domain